MPFLSFSAEIEATRKKIAERSNREQRRQRWQRRFSFLFFISFFGAIFSSSFSERLPELSDISPEILSDPIQKPTEREAFSFDYRGKKYSIVPRATYDIRALVVSKNNISSLFDSYHDSDSVDTRDLCVMWGDNVRNTIFREISVSSGSWTCFVEWKNADEGARFHHDQLSNNHLITNDEVLRDQIDAVHIGDQIRIRGLLVDYSDNEGFFRKTSMTRTDQGNHACEVLFVDSIETIALADRRFFFFSRVLSALAIFSFLGKLFLFLKRG